MVKPIGLETILSEFSEDSSAWVLQDQDSLQYLIIPDPRYPSRKPVRFFLKRDDAEAVLLEVLDVNPSLRHKNILAVEVKLKRALRGIATDTNPENADAFVVHGPVEVYEFVRDQ